MELKQLFEKKSSIIFTVLGIGLAGLTIYETAKAAIKIDRKIEVLKLEGTPKDETIKKCVPETIPAIISAAALVASIVTGNYIQNKQKLALVGVLASVKQGYKAYSEHILKENPDVDREARESAFKRVSEASLEGYNGEYRWFDEWSGRYFRATVEDVLHAEYDLNKNFIMHGQATLNEWYTLLGLDKVRDGEELGWSDYQEPFYGYRWIDFTHMPKGDYICISFPFPPVSIYRGD